MKRVDQSSLTNPSLSTEGDQPPEVPADVDELDLDEEAEGPMSTAADTASSAEGGREEEKESQGQQSSTQAIQEFAEALQRKATDAFLNGGWRTFAFENHASNSRLVSITYIEELGGGKEVQQASCSCSCMVSNGYPCRHIFRCLHHLQVFHIPTSLVNSRWYRIDDEVGHASSSSNIGEAEGGLPLASQPVVPEFSINEGEGRDLVDMREAFLHTTRDLSFQVAKMVMDQLEEGKVTPDEGRKRMVAFQGILESLLHTNGDTLCALRQLMQAKDTVLSLERALLGGQQVPTESESQVRRVSESESGVCTQSSTTDIPSSDVPPPVSNPSRKGNKEGAGRGEGSRKRAQPPSVGGLRKKRQPTRTPSGQGTRGGAGGGGRRQGGSGRGRGIQLVEQGGYGEMLREGEGGMSGMIGRPYYNPAPSIYPIPGLDGQLYYPSLPNGGGSYAPAGATYASFQYPGQGVQQAGRHQHMHDQYAQASQQPQPQQKQHQQYHNAVERNILRLLNPHRGEIAVPVPQRRGSEIK